ncbi:MAG TPA: ABC transporter permease [Vicinamibacterales bacterium]|nr:ABC transporter permease [Vicinamibacterales bacterium]
MNFSWLDVKLGVRMLAKYPGLSAIGVIGMALAIAIGAGYFAAIGAALDSTLPVPDGDRVLAIQTRTVAGPDAGDRDGVSPHDFVQWRRELKSVTDLGAFREDTRNLITADGRTYLVNVAAITASGFGLTRVAPVLGRTLLEADERPGAAPVVVIGYSEWRRVFDGDPRVLGASVRLGRTVHTVIGVMPDGFAFPIRHHYWVPLQLTGMGMNPDGAPSLQVFGRLREGFSLADARAELATVGDRMAAAFPQSHANSRPQVLPYTQAFIGVTGPALELAMRSFQLGVGLLLLIVAVNVAILVYARTATRMGEIVVRTALGASRARVVSQLFVEALVMSVSAAAVGLAVVALAFHVLLSWAKYSPEADRVPYWFTLRLTPGAVIYVAALAVLAAVVAGALPALKATGRNLHVRLQQFSSRGSGLQLGGTWTTLIVVQVAIAVTVLPAAMHNAYEAVHRGMRDPAPAANEMLRGTLTMSPEGLPADVLHARFTDRMKVLIQRLDADPEVAGVTFAQTFPGQERYVPVETESSRRIDANSTRVATNLFDVFGVRILAGRGFIAADTLPGATAVIVDQTFADAIAPGSNVVGRRVRYLRRGPDGRVEPEPWLEIVGVVPAFASSFTAPNGFGLPVPRLYGAAAPGQANPAAFVVRIKGRDPERFAQRFREKTASVDPGLQLENLTGVASAYRFDIRAFSMLALAIIAVTTSVLLLSGAGIYSMMSFTVSRRRREIGIRSALGADARRVLTGIFGRASAQLGAGVAAGLAVAAALDRASAGDLLGGTAGVLLPTVVVVIFLVGLLAALGPVRRGLAIQPIDALREE